MAGRRGWKYDANTGYLNLYKDGTLVAYFNDSDPYLTVVQGLSVTSGNTSITGAAGMYVGGPIMPKLTVADVNAQNNTFTVAQAVGGIVLHTSTTGGGTVTLDTAAHFIAGDSGIGALSTNGQAIVCYYVNDGDQTLTFANNADGKATVADTGNTIATNQAATVLIVRTAADAVKCYVVH